MKEKQQQNSLMKFHPGYGEEWRLPPHMWTADEWRLAYQEQWTHDPWTGQRRHMSDIKRDPRGALIVPPGEPHHQVK